MRNFSFNYQAQLSEAIQERFSLLNKLTNNIENLFMNKYLLANGSFHRQNQTAPQDIKC